MEIRRAVHNERSSRAEKWQGEKAKRKKPSESSPRIVVSKLVF